MCTSRVLRATIDACRIAQVPVLVDPMRTDDYSIYRGATVLKPNRVETESATGCRIEHGTDAFRAGVRLCEQLGLATAVITLDRDGMALVPRRGECGLYATRPRAVYDITGAGDVVLAVLGICWASGIAAQDAVQLGNVAGALEVERTGVSKVTRDEIRSELLAQARPGFQKILALDELAAFGQQQRELGRKVVFTNGCFDLLHVGHVTYLAEAASYGDVLVVGVNSDASVRNLKGATRPVITQTDRAAMLAALACVDGVVVFEDNTPHRMLEALRPDVLVKGGTYAPSEVVGREVVEAYGGEIRVTSVVEGISTTRLVDSIGAATSRPVLPLSVERGGPLARGWLTATKGGNMAEKLTVIIPCKDEEANIRGCICSARKVADELLIADSGSTDDTLEIARGMGASRIIEREYVNSGDFKNWAIPQASHPWVLILDADERVSDDLAEEIRGLLRQGPPDDGYWIYRANFFMGYRVRFSGWQNDRVLRLFHRDRGRYQGGTDHAEVATTTGRVSRLKHRLLHYSYWSYDEFFQRFQRYTTYQAAKWHREQRRVSLAKMFLNFPFRFLHAYIIRLGFLDGLVGLQICVLTGLYSFMKQARLWHLQCGRTREQVDADAVELAADGADDPQRQAA